ncbi:MAG: undecaprenyldiphospho-muramoylpentapeptide beta-N-acetylglucosaminyltransferase [Marinifilaceae bacterium]|jgi:UDP-N-acetylglucosamine--N-acetylmuramyl-(pentapeptide) pyrophosphoryl-undecaprenol N-acetylglucosamine transferase|nr:undecaprenyldiphospho-muramoylpentapeptide beta-N-acetylglucosaminyltransferase [Marinifilaceae bacterium]
MGEDNLRVIISGGGTGGHIFPAISIANELKSIDSKIEILFVGAIGKMEMEKVPNAGYKIIGLPIQGLQRSLTKRNLMFLPKLISSVSKAKKIIKDFSPHVAVGVGGYASGPLLYAASKNKIPILVQEQNSYAGLTNKILAKKANSICVAYDGMDKFFDSSKIKYTGNPIRKDLHELEDLREEAYRYLDIDSSKKTILVVGGSLGARTLNNSILANYDKLLGADVQLIWQTGKYYYKKIKEDLREKESPNIKILEFISRMDFAYSVADLVVSRAGAGTISELSVAKKSCILVPSPNVSEDHQTKNAQQLVDKNSAILIKDWEAEEKLVETALSIVKDDEKLIDLSNSIYKLAKPDASNLIAKEVIKLAEEYRNNKNIIT